MDHDESVLIAELAAVNTRIAGYILRALDRDAARPHGDCAGIALGHDLVVLGRAVRQHARLRAAAWGHSYLEPERGHVRATEDATPAVNVIDGPAVCGAWLVADLPGPCAAACSVCLAVLAQEPC